MKNELAKIRQQLRGSAGDKADGSIKSSSIKLNNNGSLNVARLAYDMLNNP